MLKRTDLTDRSTILWKGPKFRVTVTVSKDSRVVPNNEGVVG